VEPGRSDVWGGLPAGDAVSTAAGAAHPPIPPCALLSTV